jgi:hypothetical protein
MDITLLSALIGAGSALVGSFIGGGFTLLGTYIQYHKQIKLKNNELKQLKINLLKGFKTEIELVWDLYKRRVNDAISSHVNGTLLDFDLKVTQDNFVFYNQNASKLSELNAETLSKIINCYIFGKSLIDTYNVHGGLHEKILELSFLIGGSPNNQIYSKMRQDYIQLSAGYAEVLKETHYEALEAGDRAIEAIDKELLTLQ